VLGRIAEGRTDLVFDFLSEGHAAGSIDKKRAALKSPILWLETGRSTQGISFFSESLANEPIGTIVPEAPESNSFVMRPGHAVVSLGVG